MAKTITWKDIEDRTCVLTINDGSVATTELTPGENPFVTQTDDMDDIFQPIRSTTGNIGIVIDSVDDVVSMIGRTPITTPVTLTVEGNVRWKGFLSCESFSQEWDRGPLDISLPVMSGLEVLRGIHYPYTGLSDLGYVNFAYFLDKLNVALGNLYVNFYFPNISEPDTTLLYKFRMSNYATSDDKNTTYEMATYYDILEDICKLFGWQAIEYGQSLVFLAADVKSVVSGNNMKGYTAANISTMGGGTSVAGQNISFATVVPEFYGVDHRRSFVAGKNSVEVVGQLHEIPEDIWSMDVVEQCVYKGHDDWSQVRETYAIKKFAAYQSPGAVSPNGNIQAYNSLSGMSVDTDGYNIKFANYKSNAGAYGGSIAFERFYKYGATHELTEGDSDFVMRLITKGNSTSLEEGIIIHTNFYYTPDQNTGEKFYIKGNVLTAENANDVFDKPSDYTYYRAYFRIGNKYYNGTTWTTTSQSMILVVRDGEILSYGHQGSGGIVSYSYIPAPQDASGEVVFGLISTKSEDYAQGDVYVAYEGLKIQLNTPNNKRGGYYVERSDIRADFNEEKTKLNNGFADKFSQSCGLTLAREDVPACKGVVLKSDLTLPTSLYGNKYPEKALCDRVADYAAQSRMVLYAVVKGEGAMLSPLKSYAMRYGGRLWICLCQTVNWQNNEIMAGFFEPSYEYEL